MAKEKQAVAVPNGGVVATVDDRMAQQSAVRTLADRMGVEPTAVFMQALKNVAFKSPNVSNDQLMALIVVSNQYKLNPFTRELYAFPDRGGGIVPIVSVDGWFRIINEHEQNDGIEYAEIVDGDSKLVAGQVTIHRKDRGHPLVIREYLEEVIRNTDPWKQHKRRMLRHKTIIQGSRIAFGFAGIYEPDEGERILEAMPRVVEASKGGGDSVRALLAADPEKALKAEPTIDPEKVAEDNRDAEAESAAQRAQDAGEVQDEMPV